MSITSHTQFADLTIFTSKEQTASINTEVCGIDYCKPNYNHSRVKSNLYVLEYICCGSGTLEINGNHFKPKTGDVYIAPLGSNHSYRTDPKDQWVKIYFNVSGTLVDMLFHEYKLYGLYYLPDSGLGELFLEEYSRVRNNHDHALEAVTLAVHRILYKIAEVRDSRITQTIPPDMTRLQHHLESLVYEQPAMDDVAKAMGLSVSNMNRKFRKYFGVSPYQYLMEQKLHTAELLLLHTVKPVKEIAMDLKFADEFYFSNVFRKRRGTPPGIYRKQKKNGGI